MRESPFQEATLKTVQSYDHVVVIPGAEVRPNEASPKAGPSRSRVGYGGGAPAFQGYLTSQIHLVHHLYCM